MSSTEAGREAFSLADEVKAIQASMGRIRDHARQVARSAQGMVGSQRAHAAKARAEGLHRMLDLVEAPLGVLAQEAGVTGEVPVSPGQPVHGSFVVRVSERLPAQEELTVWPQKPISQVINEALVLCDVQQQGGTWGLELVGMGLVQAFTVGEAGVQPGDTLLLSRQSVGDPQ